MLKNYTIKQLKHPLKSKKCKDLKNVTLQTILSFSKALEVVKSKNENIELVLN